MKILKIVLLAFIPVLIIDAQAYAHKVIIFAWAEDGMIYTESQFGSKRKARECDIKVYNEKGDMVHQGKTDSKGEYSFKIPENTDGELTLKLEAGPGHQAQWNIPKKELIGALIDKPIAENISVSANKAAIKEKRLAEKEKLEAGPSAFKILTGIGIIFLLAFTAQLVKRKMDRK